jgi:hypothetical protein
VSEVDETISLLREIRDNQREMIAIAAAQRAALEEQLARSRESVAESIGLQRTALSRARTVSLVAIPGILACVAAIIYLVVRYL